MPDATLTHVYSLPRCFVRGHTQVTVAAIIANADGSAASLNGGAISTYTLATGSTALFTTTAINISGGTASLSSALDAFYLENEALSDGLLETWDLAVGTQKHKFTRPVYLVRQLMHPTITDTDLVALHSDLLSLIDPDQSTFEVQRSDAWVVLNKWLIMRGNRPQLIMDDWALRDLHRFLSLANIFGDFASSTGTDDRYQQLAEFYRKAAKDEFNGLTFRYDFDEDGTIGDGEVKAAQPITMLQVPHGWNL